ncbi:hypothetical protein TcasGA2_TC012939 [Tribolium castaneum]|uniref:Uncharacterized protein n=1 Tax=Tribolium castaneum TaxID=7070 RepID=D7EKA7_TRICA|nr:hypothetical protein TcasGA2_TC012939 [Tribolium castaneum]
MHFTFKGGNAGDDLTVASLFNRVMKVCQERGEIHELICADELGHIANNRLQCNCLTKWKLRIVFIRTERGSRKWEMRLELQRKNQSRAIVTTHKNGARACMVRNRIFDWLLF